MKNLHACLFAFFFAFFVADSSASTIVSGTLSITNYAALTNAISGQSYTLNSDTRTFTNSVANAATQIRVRTNDSAATILLSIAAQASQYPFTPILSMTTSAGTNITFRATSDTALTITISPTNWGKVTYSTQTVGTAMTVIRVPLASEDAVARTNNATLLWDGLDNYSQDRGLGRVEFAGRVEFDAGLGLHGRGLVATNYTLTTNDIYLGADTRSNTNLIFTLPTAASSSNHLFLIKDEGGAGATNTIKIYPQSGDRIDGLTNLVVSNNFGGVQLRSRGGTNYALLASGGGVSGGTGGSGGGSVPLTNSVWVAKNGSDSTGARGDPSKAFLTLGAAKTNAASGDTVFVMPGTYDEKNLLKNGVNWHFFNGAKVIYTGAANGSMFDDGSNGANGAVTSAITGGEFAMPAGSIYPAINLENESVVDIECASLTAEAGGTYQSSTSSLTVSGASISALYWYAVQINGAGPVTTLHRCTLAGEPTGPPLAALKFGAANTNCVLRDCVLLSDPSIPTIKGDSSGTQVRLQGGLTTTAGPDANITIVTADRRWFPGGKIDANSQPITNVASITFTNGTTIPGSTRGYITLASPFSADGAGAVFQTTNTLPYFGQVLFSGTGDPSTNYVEYRITVPEDLDTAVDLKIERWKFRLAENDTDAMDFNISMVSVPDSDSYDSTSLDQSVALGFAGDASGLAGDVETVSNVTLTDWKANLTAGQLWVIRVNRDGAGDTSTNGCYSGPLVLSYGIAQ